MHTLFASLHCSPKKCTMPKARFFYAAPVYNTWGKVAVLSENNVFHSEYLEFMQVRKIDLEFDFKKFKAEDFLFHDYQPIEEISMHEAINKRLEKQHNWVVDYLMQISGKSSETVESNNEVSKLKAPVRVILDALRMQSLNIENEIPILLFLLSLYKEGIILKSMESGIEPSQWIESLLRESKLEHAEVYQRINTILDLNRINTKVFNDILGLLSQIQAAILNAHFPQLFENILNEALVNRGKTTGQFLLPSELTELMCLVAGINSNSNVFNPFAGLASFSLQSDSYKSYLGEEVNEYIWVLGLLRLMAHGELSKVNYFQRNSLKNWPFSSNSYDIVISAPPIGESMKKDWVAEDFKSMYGLDSFKTISDFFIGEGSNLLNEQGRLIGLVSSSFLFTNDPHRRVLRKRLISDDLIDTIISLPIGLLPNTNRALAIVFVNKDKSHPNKVRFIDASKYSNSNNRLFLKGVEPLINGEYNDAGAIRLVDSQKIENEDYNLNVSRYFQKPIEGLQLKELLKPVAEKKKDLPAKGHCIDISVLNKLKKEKLNNTLDLKSIEITSIKLWFHRKVEESCILFSKRSVSLSPTYFEYNMQPIFLSPDIYSFSINTELAEPSFLAYELQKSYVAHQADLFRQGVSVPIISRADLLRIRVKLPTIEDQKKQLLSIRSKQVEIAEEQISSLKKETKLDSADDNSVLRHQIAGPLKNLRGAVKSIHSILEGQVKRDYPEIFDLKINPKRKYTLGRYLNILDRDIAKVSRLVQSSSSDLSIYQSKLTSFDIFNFTKKYTASLKERESDVCVEFWHDEELFSNECIGQVLIDGNKDLLEMALDNLVDNAFKHGFTNFNGKSYISFELLFEQKTSEIKITVSNSGIPLRQKFDLNLYKRRGGKAGAHGGDGTGGWIVDSVIKKHRGRLIFVDKSDNQEPSNELVTCFELYFPIKEIVKDE